MIPTQNPKAVKLQVTSCAPGSRQPSIVSGGWTHTARPRGAVAGQAPTLVPARTDLDTWRSAEPPDTQGPWPAALLRAPSRHVHRPEAGSGCRAGEGEGRWNVLELEEAVAQHRERAERHQTVYSKTVNSALCDFPLRERFAQRFGESRSVSLAAAWPRPAPPAGSRGPPGFQRRPRARGPGVCPLL